MKSDLQINPQPAQQKTKKTSSTTIVKPHNEVVKPPQKEVVNEEIPGIEVLDIEEATEFLWKNNIYAEAGMGCTGPVIMINEKNHKQAIEILRGAGYID